MRKDNKDKQFYIEKIANIEKFYTAYSSVVVYFRPGIQQKVRDANINLNRANIFLRVLSEPPREENNFNPSGISFSIEELQKYILNEGQFKVFENSIILLYGIIEDFFVFFKTGKHTDEVYEVLNKNTISAVSPNIRRDLLNFVFILKEMRNCFIHDNGIWSKKRAEQLSKNIEGKKISNYPLKVLEKEFKVSDLLRFGAEQTRIFDWVVTKVKDIINYSP